MATQTHLIVEAGPERGRDLGISPDGARVGRSSSNDIALKDPVMSRFHCRFFWNSLGKLAVVDLGSSNCTEVNGRPIEHEMELKPGDRVTLGDSILKVVCSSRDGQATPAAVPEPSVVIKSRADLSTDSDGAPRISSDPELATLQTAPVPRSTGSEPSPAKRPFTMTFNRLRDLRRPADRPTGTKASRLRRSLIIAIVVLAALVAIIFLNNRTAPTGRRIAIMAPANAADLRLGYAIQYEKVEASTDSIFRYNLNIENGHIAIQIDDLKNNRHVSREKNIDEAAFAELIAAIENAGFFELMPDYQGVSRDLFDQIDLSVTVGRKTHRSRVINRLEPDSFKHVRELVEEFGRNELGLAALAMAPDKLVHEARESLQRGRKLADEREVKIDNLAASIRVFQEAEWYLETLEPKPDFYPDIVARRAQCERDLTDRFNNLIFLADKAINLRDWNNAARQLRKICEMIPDRADPRNKEAVKKLLDVERRLGPNRN